ncbi:DUF2249 domain-containing protein [Pelagibacterium sediminicola]|uniref:DUF2249 domain-containing protein n=1 Tax=Pelagibacterium sediminicola TaxID=2248761 RepID=UPI000E313E11|nr:DUF2249 domain-containing protein [Pelagibacterium sediminicola]
MTQTFVDLDVRPILLNGGEPFSKIMEAVERLAPDEGLRLYATFKPLPLFQVLGAKGFSPEAREIEGGDWEVLFHRTGEQPQAQEAPGEGAAHDDSGWPEPVQLLDNRDLDPPEPMVRILAALETMASGAVLCALLDREPVFLFPELEKRGHAWQCGPDADAGTYRLLVRVGG